MRGTYFVRIPVPPDVARGLPPVTVLPLEDVRRMLQEMEAAEDGARQSGTVDGLRGKRPSRIQFEEMDGDRLAGGEPQGGTHSKASVVWID